jgi:Uma2 family endonuclease
MPRILENAKQMSFEEYLEFEKTAKTRHEFVDGFVFAMAGGTDNHNSITLNIATELKSSTRAASCRIFSSDVTLLTPSGIGYYPDVFVTCQEENDGSRVKRFPCFLVEVLSKSTEDIDRGEKWENYRNIHALQSYILVSQKKALVEIYKRQQDGSWLYSVLENKGGFDLPCIDATLTLEQIYEDIDFSKQES